MLQVQKLAVVGLGLLGGSVALAARARGVAAQIIAIDPRGKDLSPAVREGVVNSYTSDLARGLADADLVLLAGPVETIRLQLPGVLGAVAPGAIVTDVGSTKRVLVEEAAQHDRHRNFVGSHPMVGGHHTGWQHARADLMEGGVVYVTPFGSTDLDRAARVGHFWEALGMRLVFTHPARHDFLCALLSHLPHLTAATLMDRIATSREDVNLVRQLCGRGLLDTTRIAMGSADVWEQICRHNSDNIATLLDGLAEDVQRLAGMIRRNDSQGVNVFLAGGAVLRSQIEK